MNQLGSCWQEPNATPLRGRKHNPNALQYITHNIQHIIKKYYVCKEAGKWNA